jgi:hypothetical protein
MSYVGKFWRVEMATREARAGQHPFRDRAQFLEWMQFWNHVAPECWQFQERDG